MGIRALHKTTAGFAGFTVMIAACNQLGGIHSGFERECDGIASCPVEVPGCRAAVACDDGFCVFEDAPDGTPLMQQVPGDCVELICDGLGKVKRLDNPMDIPDDGDPCTYDECRDGQPTHKSMAEVPCYTGPWWARAKGICIDGIQQCDAQGQPIGGCVGEVLPQEEYCDVLEQDEDCDVQVNESGTNCVCSPGSITECHYSGPMGTKDIGICRSARKSCNQNGLGYGPCSEEEQTPVPESCDAAMLDEDCDGELNEGGSGCACGDGYFSTDEEECDDGNLDSADLCTTSCKLAKCGDGIIQPVLGEECDDGNTNAGDACPSTCGSPITHVTAGDIHSCALHSFIVKCWGKALGLGDTQIRGDNPNEMGGALPIVHLGNAKFAKSIVTGGQHTCALLNDNSVKCWGGEFIRPARTGRHPDPRRFSPRDGRQLTACQPWHR